MPHLRIKSRKTKEGTNMDANGYQILAMRTKNNLLSAGQQLLNAAMGLSGESGEFSEIVKKIFFQGHDLTEEKKEAMAKELGDVAWYLALACDQMGFLLGDILDLNIAKLRERYPEHFESLKSVYRYENGKAQLAYPTTEVNL
jgi:NTP pyrophosphatase (non-canonical NTP hydrolase)